MSFCVEVWLNSIEFKLDLVERMSWVERFNTIEVYQKSMDGIPRSWETSPFWILQETIAARKWNSWSLLAELEIQTNALYSTGKKVIVAHHEYQQNSPCNRNL